MVYLTLEFTSLKLWQLKQLLNSTDMDFKTLRDFHAVSIDLLETANKINAAITQCQFGAIGLINLVVSIGSPEEPFLFVASR